MAATISHRGPDHTGVLAEGIVGLGYVRLSILDLSESGNQPMTDETGRWTCVYNGEIYNYQELRNELLAAGVRLRSTTDTEVLINLFARHGADCLSRLNGMFAFAAWDRHLQELWIARDHLGVKPLYYSLHGKQLVFGSEMKALLAITSSGPEPSPVGVWNYLSYGHAMAPHTFVEGINKLLPGHYLHASNRGVRCARFWQFPRPAQRHEPASEAQAVDELHNTLETAVRRQLVADVPVGVFLSGGIDSSLILALASKHYGRMHTYTAVFEGAPDIDESEPASAISRLFNSTHTVIPISSLQLRAGLEKLAYHYDEPFADAAGVAVLEISRRARADVKVALSGEGGDELFGGYQRYSAERLGTALEFLPSFANALIAKLGKSLQSRRRLSRSLSAFSIRDRATRYRAWLQVFTPDALEWLLTDDIRKRLPPEIDPAVHYRALLEDCRQSGPVARSCYLDAQTWLPDTYLEKADKASMAASLELRVPMLDLDLVALASRMTEKRRIRRLTTKYLLRRVARRYLPDALVNSPKRGLSVPLKQWLKTDLAQWVREILLDERTIRRGLLNRGAVEHLLRTHIDGEADCATQIWVLVMMELWFRSVRDSYIAN